MASVIAFDVNKTLLDLSALDPLFERAFGSASAREEWFAQLLQNALVATVIGAYRPFDQLAKAALDMTAAAKGDARPRGDIIDSRGHEDTATARGRGAKPRAPASGRTPARSPDELHAPRCPARLRHAGLTRYFEAILSADAVERFKPAPEPYRMAAKQLGVKRSELRLVAAHAWDIAGAASAGCATAFVARPGKVLNPFGPKPEISGSGLGEVTELIIRADGSEHHRKPRKSG